MTMSRVWLDWPLVRHSQALCDESARMLDSRCSSCSTMLPVADCLLPAEMDKSHLFPHKEILIKDLKWCSSCVAVCCQDVGLQVLQLLNYVTCSRLFTASRNGQITLVSP
eukprot:TRINITY_DN15468_c0_g1_i1.p1 TRINITY_DN15468_c0_g1~~TRINITY_DN15468_c0_g1_i1.p1  ORF type:complete len:110 (-),score=17.24 TRINITY_DN15468_c0_g1_i1:75-404(-)